MAQNGCGTIPGNLTAQEVICPAPGLGMKTHQDTQERTRNWLFVKRDGLSDTAPTVLTTEGSQPQQVPTELVGQRREGTRNHRSSKDPLKGAPTPDEAPLTREAAF